VDVAVGEGDPELPRVGPLDGLLADELDLVALLLVVDERAVEVGVLEDALHLVLAERLDVLLALPGLDLPALLAVVCRHPVIPWSTSSCRTIAGRLFSSTTFASKPPPPVNLPVFLRVLTAWSLSMPPIFAT
jgi:hypothetical protein